MNRKVLLSSFHLNAHAVGFHPQTQKAKQCKNLNDKGGGPYKVLLKAPCCVCFLQFYLKYTFAFFCSH